MFNLKKTVKFLASILAVVLLITTFSVAFSAYAVDGNIVGDYSFTVVDNPYENIEWNNGTLHAFKASTHAHTVRSDADIELNDTIWYHYQKGYEVFSLTDHGTVNGVEIKYNGNIVGATGANGVTCGWTQNQTRCTLYGYQSFVHGNVDEISETDYINIINGENLNSRPAALVEAKRGMFNLPLGNEANAISSNKCHVNLYGRSYAHGATRTDSWPLNVVEESYNNGSYSRINHVGEWTEGNDDPGVYTASWVNDFVSIFQTYCPNRAYSDAEKSTWESSDLATGEVFKKGVIGMELVNTSDSRTKNDRELVYDASLMILAPQGINMYGFCEDDSHEESDVDRNAQYFLVNDGTASSPADEAFYDSLYGSGASYGYTGDIRNSMTNGEFYACSKNSKRSYELGDGFSANGDYPQINNFEIDTDKNQLIISVNNANKARIVADAKILETKTLTQKADYTTVVFDLNAYENQINSYVRVYFTGEGGITYMQPILLSKTYNPTSTVSFNLPSTDTQLNVYDAQGALVQPENTDLIYMLDAGDYTYVASRPGYNTTDPISFTVSQADIDASVKRIIDVTLEKNSEIVFTYLYVPETIYLDPSDLRTFKYYVDRANCENGALNNQLKTTGNVYFSRDGASDVSISWKAVQGADSVSLALTTPNTQGSELSTEITSGVMSSAVSSSTQGVIEWTATYTFNGETLTSTAYSYVYAPLTGAGSVAAAGGYAETSKNVLGWAHSTMSVTGTIWLAGVHSVSGGSVAYKYSPLGGETLISASGVSNITTTGIGMSTGSDDSSGGSVTVNPSGTSGALTIDTSRYNNFNQIPYLSIGLDINNGSSCDENATQTLSFGDTVVFTKSDAPANSLSAFRYSTDNTDPDNDLDFAIDSSVASITVNGQVRGYKSSRTDTVNGTVTLNLAYVNKAALRQQIDTAVNKAYQESWFTNQVDYNSYIQTLKKAYIALGNPAATASEVETAASELKAAVNGAQLKEGTASVTYYDQNLNPLKTDTLTYTLGETLIVSSQEILGYTYADKWEYVVNSSVGKTGTATYGSIMATNDECQWNFYYQANTYNVTFDAGYDSYVPDNSNVTKILFNTSLSLPSNKPSREGYTFSGWYFDGDEKTYQPSSTVKWNYPADGTFTAIYTGNEYSLTYNSNGGSILETTYYKATFGDYFDITTETPTKDGSVFIGWELMTSQNESLGLYTPGGRFNWDYAGNLILVAVWEQLTTTVTLEPNGGEVSQQAVEILYGDTYSTLPTPTKLGYEFVGWYADEALTELVDGETVMETLEPHTLYAKWVLGQYDVIYYVDSTEYHRDTYAYAEKIVALEAPTKTGHTFSGWSEIPSTMPDYDVIVTGTFSTNTYKITYYVDNYEYKSYDIAYATAITPPVAPTIEGYTFSGWVGVPQTMPDYDVTVTGTYSLNSHYLTYYLNGEEYNKELYNYGEALTALEAPSQTGYSFSGWSSIPQTMPDNDVNVYGTLSPVTYVITYYVDGEFYTSQNYYYGDSVTAIAEPTKKGYTFSGWSEIPTTMPANHISVSGTFSADLYTITYKVDGEVYQTVNMAAGETIVLIDAPIKEGYTFSGWSTAPATMPSRNLTINGLFTANTYTYKFVLNGVEKTEWAISAKYGTAISAPVPELADGYVFSGWSPSVPATMGAENTTFYGTTYMGVVTYSFDINGAVGTAPESEQYTVGQKVTLPTNSTFAKTGYTFSGWATSNDATTGVTSVTVASQNTTMYAVWAMSQLYIEPNETTDTVIDEINSLIYGVAENLTENEFETQYIQIVGNNGDIVYEKGLDLGTGTKVVLKNTSDNTVAATYTLVVYGDVDGDGVADGQDVILATMIKDNILSKADVGAAVYEAADCNHDGIINDDDITEIINSGTLSFDIIQSK